MSSTNSSSSTNRAARSSGSHSTSSRAIVPYVPRTRSSNANVAKSRVLRPRTSSSFLAAASDEPQKKKGKTNKNNNNDKLIFPAYQLPDRNLNTVNDKVLARTEERRELVNDRLQGESTLTVSVRSGQVILLLSL